MDIKYKGKNISLISSNVTNVNNGNKTIDNYFSDVNMVGNLPNIQILYENFIKIYNNNNPHNSNDNYEKLIDLAMLAEQIENYEDMLFFVKEVIKNKKGLMDIDERNFFSRACKNYISSNRNLNRIIEDYEDKERKKGHSDYLSYIIEYKNIKETISFIKYHNVIKFIEDNIIKKDNFRNYDDEAKTFFYKKFGDFHRYLCEIDKFKSKYINEADKYYNESLKFASKLPIYNSDKLGAILNSTNFCYHFLNEKKKAIDLAKSTIKKFDLEAKNFNRDNEDFKDIFSIYDIMKENLEMWEKE